MRHDVETTFWLVTPDGGSLLMQSLNVSAGGALLSVQDPNAPELPEVGTQLRFVVTALDVDEEAKLAEVVRHTPIGMAIRYVAW